MLGLRCTRRSRQIPPHESIPSGTKAKYGFDVFAVASGSPKETQLMDFFGGVNVKWRRLFQLPVEQRKGIVKVVP